MTRKTSAIALTLLGAGTAAFIVSSAVSSCQSNGYATTRGSSGTYRHMWWGPSFFGSASSGGSSSSGSHSSSISRGGFGGTAAGHAGS